MISMFVSSLPALLNSAAMGLVNSLGSGVPGGQSSTPNLNPPNQIDPSSIERGYAALGLTYQANQMPQQLPQTNMPNQGLQGQPGMRSLNAMGEFTNEDQTRPSLTGLECFWLTNNTGLSSLFRRKPYGGKWWS